MSDQEFIARVRSMERKLYRIAHAILWSDADCADAIQEAVFKGWMKKGSLRESIYFETWLVRILINECKNLIRRQKNAPLPLIEETAGTQPLKWASERDKRKCRIKSSCSAASPRHWQSCSPQYWPQAV